MATSSSAVSTGTQPNNSRHPFWGYWNPIVGEVSKVAGKAILISVGLSEQADCIIAGLTALNHATLHPEIMKIQDIILPPPGQS